MSPIKKLISLPLIALLLLASSANAALTSPELDSTSYKSNVAASGDATNTQWLAYSRLTGSPLAWNPADIASVDFRGNAGGSSPFAVSQTDKRGQTTQQTIEASAMEFNAIDESNRNAEDATLSLYLLPDAEGGLSMGIALTLAAAAWLLLSTLAVFFMAKRDKSNHPHLLVTIEK